MRGRCQREIVTESRSAESEYERKWGIECALSILKRLLEKTGPKKKAYDIIIMLENENHKC